MTKKNKWYKDPKYLGSIIALLILIWGINVKIVDFSKLGETTKALAGQVQSNVKRVSDVERYIQVQQEANELQRQWQEEQQRQYQAPQYYPQQAYPNQPITQPSYYPGEPYFPIIDPPPYEPPPSRECWDQGYQYDCEAGNWL